MGIQWPWWYMYPYGFLTLWTLTVARSYTWSTAWTTPCTFSPSLRYTCTREAPATTCALVKIKPSGRTMNPDPLECTCLQRQKLGSYIIYKLHADRERINLWYLIVLWDNCLLTHVLVCSNAHNNEFNKLDKKPLSIKDNVDSS